MKRIPLFVTLKLFIDKSSLTCLIFGEQGYRVVFLGTSRCAGIQGWSIQGVMES